MLAAVRARRSHGYRSVDSAPMEIEGHPTQDLVEELERRGAIRFDGSSAGPDATSVAAVSERAGELPGFWMFLPTQAYATGFDELPG